MEITYRKVFIKTADDLPKEDGFYFCHWKSNANTHNTQMAVQYYDDSIKGLWYGKDWFDWYLQPIEQEPKPTKADIESFDKSMFSFGEQPQERTEHPRKQETSNRGSAEQISNILNMDLGIQKISQVTRKRLTNELTELFDEGNDTLLFEFATWLSTECPPVVFDIEELIKQFKNKYK